MLKNLLPLLLISVSLFTANISRAYAGLCSNPNVSIVKVPTVESIQATPNWTGPTPPMFVAPYNYKPDFTITGWKCHPNSYYVSPLLADRAAAKQYEQDKWNQIWPGYDVHWPWIDTNAFYSHVTIYCTGTRSCSGGGYVYAVATCPTGHTLSGTAAAGTYACSSKYTCPSGYTFSATAMSIPKPANGICPSGSTLSGSTCVTPTNYCKLTDIASKPKNLRCDQYLSNGVYVNDPLDPDCAGCPTTGAASKAKGNTANCAGS